MLAKFGTGEWQERLDRVVAMMRELSLQTEPQAMVRAYGRRLRETVPVRPLLRREPPRSARARGTASPGRASGRRGQPLA